MLAQSPVSLEWNLIQTRTENCMLFRYLSQKFRDRCLQSGFRRSLSFCWISRWYSLYRLWIRPMPWSPPRTNCGEWQPMNGHSRLGYRWTDSILIIRLYLIRAAATTRFISVSVTLWSLIIHYRWRHLEVRSIRWLCLRRISGIIWPSFIILPGYCRFISTECSTWLCRQRVAR